MWGDNEWQVGSKRGVVRLLHTFDSQIVTTFWISLARVVDFAIMLWGTFQMWVTGKLSDSGMKVTMQILRDIEQGSEVVIGCDS